MLTAAPSPPRLPPTAEDIESGASTRDSVNRRVQASLKGAPKEKLRARPTPKLADLTKSRTGCTCVCRLT